MASFPLRWQTHFWGSHRWGTRGTSNFHDVCERGGNCNWNSQVDLTLTLLRMREFFYGLWIDIRFGGFQGILHTARPTWNIHCTLRFPFLWIFPLLWLFSLRFNHFILQKPSKIKMVFYCYNKTLQSTSSMNLYNANPGVVFVVAWAQTAGLVLAWTIKSQNPNQTFLSLVSLIWLSCSSHVGSCPTFFKY